MTEILLVDDERTIRESLSCQLREAGFGVRVAATGAANSPRPSRRRRTFLASTSASAVS